MNPASKSVVRKDLRQPYQRKTKLVSCLTTAVINRRVILPRNVLEFLPLSSKSRLGVFQKEVVNLKQKMQT